MAQNILLKSFTGNHWNRICITDKTCDCEQFLQTRRGCEHLAALGIHRLKPFFPSTHPTFSQALSGLVKSIRIRRVANATTTSDGYAVHSGILCPCGNTALHFEFEKDQKDPLEGVAESVGYVRGVLAAI